MNQSAFEAQYRDECMKLVRQAKKIQSKMNMENVPVGIILHDAMSLAKGMK